MRVQGISKHIDWVTISLFSLLVLLGWINIYAANYQISHPNIFDNSMEYGKQFIWIIGAFLLIIAILLLDSDFIINSSIFIYLGVIALLILVLLFGKEVNGAKSWFGIGSVGIQPSEFAKFATALAVARYLGQPGIKFNKTNTKIRAYVIIGFPALLILLQPDAGTVLVFIGFVFVLYREGLSGNILLLGFFAIVLGVLSLLFKPILLHIPLINVEISGQYVVMIVLLLIGVILFFLMMKFVMPRIRKGKIQLLVFTIIGSLLFLATVDRLFENVLDDHQKKRINILLGLEEDPLGAGYNVNQSKTAIGSGEFFGKGFLKGQLTKYKYVPMQSTDFIFCTVVEEWGFVGSSVIVLLFIMLMIRLIIIAERQKLIFSRIYGYAVASIIFMHFLINIGMAIGLAPVIGIPLPFFSYGGSSLWGFTILIFFLIRLDADRINILG
jgi:rod shape determining protein RodA